MVQLTFHSLTARASCNPFESSEATEATEATRVALAAAARTGDAWHTHSPRCAVGRASGAASIARYKVVIRREVSVSTHQRVPRARALSTRRASIISELFPESRL